MPRGTAELVVQFVADVSRLSDGVSKIEGAGNKLKSFGKKAALGIGGAFAVTKVAQFGKASLAAAEESEQATSRLEQVFSTMGDSTGKAAKAAEDYASKLSKTIGVDDEVIMGAQAKLATFKDVSSETARQSGIFDRATAAAADLAAAGFGTMDSNAVQLGKALQDPVKGLAALGRSGVTFTAAQKESIKQMVASGDTLGAQKEVLAAVEGQVKGTAGATATGSEKMSVAFGEVQESVGTALLPAFEGLSGALTALAPIISGVIGWMTDHAALLAPFAAGLVAIAVAMKVLTIATGTFGVTLNASMIIVVLIIAVIAALVVAVVVAYNKVGWFRAGVDAAFAGIKVAFGWIKTAALAVFNFIKAKWPLLLSILGGPIGLAVTLIIKNWSKIKSGAVSLFNTVKSWFSKIVGVIRGAVSGISGAVRGIVNAFKAIGRGAMDAVSAVSRWIGSIAQRIRNVLGAVSGAVGSIVNAIKGPINAVIRAWNGMGIPGIHIHQTLPGPIPDIDFDWSGVEFPNIPQLARGGILTGPTMFLGGEAGTEIVTPEALMRQIIREERGPVVAQLNVQAWNPPAVAKAIANELAYLEVRRR